MNDEALLALLQPGEALVMPAYPQLPAFDIPVFLEPLDAEAIARANEDDWLVGIVLDGDGPLGREWIAKIRQLCHMLPGNTRHFGASPYYYAFRYWRTSPDYSLSSTHHDRKPRALQYLVYVQGLPDPLSRRHIALAMLRQWQAQGIPSHQLTTIKPDYFAQGPALLRAPAVGPFPLVLEARGDIRK